MAVGFNIVFVESAPCFMAQECFPSPSVAQFPFWNNAIRARSFMSLLESYATRNMRALWFWEEVTYI
jgi:hypothetical protein